MIEPKHYIPSMPYRSKYFLIPIFFLSFHQIPLFADSLWEKALRHTDIDDMSVLSGMEMESTQVNRAGDVIKTTTMELVLDEETGEMTIVSAFEGDKDITEKQQRRAERSRDDEEDRTFVHGIFNPEKVEGLTLTPTDMEVIVSGYRCKVYEFHMEDEMKMGPGKPKPTIEEGRVYLEIENGMPIRLESVLIDGPNMIHDMNFVMSGFADSEGHWRPGSIEVEFAGHMFVYMAGTMTMRFVYSDM